MQPYTIPYMCSKVQVILAWSADLQSQKWAPFLCVCVLVHAEFASSIPRYIYIYMEHYISCYIGSKTIFNESFACSFYIVINNS